MRFPIILIGLATLSCVTAANSQSRNASAHAQSCMEKSGFNMDMWRAHQAGTDRQVLKYIQCRDGVSQKQALEIGRRDRNFSPGF